MTGAGAERPVIPAQGAAPGPRPPSPRSPAPSLRLAVLQAEAVSGDVAGNARAAADLVRGAAREGARVAVLPELHLCAYDLPAVTADPDGCAVRADKAGGVEDERLAPLGAAAADTGALVLLGAAVRRADGALTNSVLAVHPDGAVTSVYDKQHLWQADEARLFAAGHRPAAVEVDGWQLGLGVCYDMSFPEHARAAALAGAHVYLCPSSYVTGSEHRAAVYMASRALENTVYSVFANPVGGPADRPSNGSSAVFGPDGVRLGEPPAADARTLVVELDLAAIDRVRAFLHMLEEQPSHYSYYPGSTR